MEIFLPKEKLSLEGDLEIPSGAKSVVLFAHGSGSSRHSRRNQYVAHVLREAGIGTLLFDLLTPKEDLVYETRFNIELLTRRLASVTAWLQTQPGVLGMKLGYFGASTGAAAALWAAAQLGGQIGAVVSRGGRPDLAMSVLGQVRAPTLLIVGGWDDAVIELNQKAYEHLHCLKELRIVPGATHLFEESGTLEAAARAAQDWFRKHLK